VWYLIGVDYYIPHVKAVWVWVWVWVVVSTKKASSQCSCRGLHHGGFSRWVL